MKKDFFELPVGDTYNFNQSEGLVDKKRVFSASIDDRGADAGTIYVCAKSLEDAMLLIETSDFSGGNNRYGGTVNITYIGKLRENTQPTKYWPSETFIILGDSEGLLFPVDEKAEEVKEASAEQAWRNEQFELLFQEEKPAYEMVEVYCGISTEKWPYDNSEDAMSAFEKRLKGEFCLNEQDITEAIEKGEWSFITGYSLSIKKTPTSEEA